MTVTQNVFKPQGSSRDHSRPTMPCRSLRFGMRETAHEANNESTEVNTAQLLRFGDEFTSADSHSQTRQYVGSYC